MSGFSEFVTAMLPSAVGVRLSRAICDAYASMPIEGMLNPTGNSPPPRPSGSIQQPPVPRSMEDIQGREQVYEDTKQREEALERVR